MTRPRARARAWSDTTGGDVVLAAVVIVLGLVWAGVGWVVWLILID